HNGKYVTVKHFACNNQETSRAGMSANLSERALREIYLEGFRLAITKGGAKAVMTSYNKVNHVYSPNSHDLCTKVLRNEWGFDGLVMTDWMSTNKGLAGKSAAYKAGNDLIMPGGKGVVKECLKDYNAGRLSEDEINTCLRRVLALVIEGGENT
ncbi:MAG: glycoside hydrolase family 3 protein, partial [Lachnospiraceae bacterium]|nr:glycoside hydrolase family 3 protein [Lachnospiraceae bacterium]